MFDKEWGNKYWVIEIRWAFCIGWDGERSEWEKYIRKYCKYSLWDFIWLLIRRDTFRWNVRDFIIRSLKKR